MVWQRARGQQRDARDGETFHLPSSLAILLVCDVLHPLDVRATSSLLNGEMRQRGRRRRAMPVLLTGRNPDHIAGPNLLDGITPPLHPAGPRRDDQRLAE